MGVIGRQRSVRHVHTSKLRRQNLNIAGAAYEIRKEKKTEQMKEELLYSKDARCLKTLQRVLSFLAGFRYLFVSLLNV